jgi:hypothetical protein
MPFKYYKHKQKYGFNKRTYQDSKHQKNLSIYSFLIKKKKKKVKKKIYIKPLHGEYLGAPLTSTQGLVIQPPEVKEQVI